MLTMGRVAFSGANGTIAMLDHGFAGLQEIYDTLVDLRMFVQINHSGFRKIVKKVRTQHVCAALYLYLVLSSVSFNVTRMLQFDKTTKEDTSKAFMKRLEKERFYASNDIDLLSDRVFGLTSKYVFHYCPSRSYMKSPIERCCCRIITDTGTSWKLATWSAA